LYPYNNPVTQRAAGSEYYSIGSRSIDTLGHLGCHPLIEVLEELCIPHEAEVETAHVSYIAVDGQFPETIDGEDTVRILIGVAMVIVLMSHHQVAAVYISWDLPPAIIAIQRERLLCA
jgi:hypothetical protein